MEIQMRVIKSLLPLCHVSKWVLQSVTNWPSAFIVVLTRKWKLKDLRSLSASNRYLFYGFLQNDRWKEVLLWLLAVHSVAFMFRYREKMTKFEKKSYTVFSNYLVTSTQIGRFKKKDSAFSEYLNFTDKICMIINYFAKRVWSHSN